MRICWTARVWNAEAINAWKTILLLSSAAFTAPHHHHYLTPSKKWVFKCFHLGKIELLRLMSFKCTQEFWWHSNVGILLPLYNYMVRIMDYLLLCIQWKSYYYVVLIWYYWGKKINGFFHGGGKLATHILFTSRAHYTYTILKDGGERFFFCTFIIQKALIDCMRGVKV